MTDELERRPSPDPADVEAHGYRKFKDGEEIAAADDEDETDTEGHAKFRGAGPTDERAANDDDFEGHDRFKGA